MKYPKILAIDDNPVDLDVMKALIQEVFSDAIFISTLSGKKGIELCLSEKPDVVLIDIVMPEMDGFEVCQKLKANKSTKIIPIIVVTAANKEKESWIKALECGADAFLTKPVDKSELTAQVRAMIRIKESEDRKIDENERLATLVYQKTKHLEKELKESEEKYRRMVNLLPDAIIIHAEGKIVFANAVTYALLGASSPDQIIGKQAIDFVHPEDRNMAFARIKNIFESGNPTGFAEERFIKCNNEVINAEVIGIPITYLGKPAIQTILRDITSRKKADTELMEREVLFRSLFNASPDAIVLIDPHHPTISWPILDCNEATCRMNGYTREELVGQSIDIINAAYGTRQERSAYLQNLRKNKIIHLESTHRHKDGHVFAIEVSTSIIVVGGRELVLGIDRDITERKRVQEAIEESEKKYSVLFYDSPDSYLIITEGVFTDCNRATELMLLGDKTKIIGLTPDALSPEFQPDGKKSSEAAKEKIEYAFRHGKNTFEWVHRRFDGSDFYVEVSIASMTLRDKPTLFTTWRDITERKQAEEMIKASEERYRSFISQVSEGVYRLECDKPMPLNLSVEAQMDFISDHMILTECNDAFVKMYGANNQNEIIGKAHPFFYGDPNKPMNREALRKFIENGYRAENATTEEVSLSSQKQYFSNNSIGIIENNHLVRIWGTQTDITEKIKADRVQQVLFTISNAALSSINLSELIEIISNEIGKLLDSTNFYIAFYDEATNMLSTIYKKDEKDEINTWSAEKSITGYVVKNQKSLFVKDFEMEELAKSGEIAIYGTPSKVWLGVPLMMDKIAIGAVVVQSYDNANAYTEKDRKMLEFVSHQISISIERKKAEQKLKLLDRAIDYSSVSIVITNKDGLIEFTNPKFTEISGYLPEEVMGKNPRILKSGKHPDKFYREIWKSLSSGKKWNGEICNKRKNGTLYWENVYISPVEGEDGEISHYIGLKEDISEKKLFEETQRITLEISQISFTKTSLNSFLKEVHKKLNKIIRADNIYVALYDSASDTYTLAYQVDEFNKFEIGIPLKLTNGYTDLVRKTGAGQLIICGSGNDPVYKEKVVGYGKIPSVWLGVPLKSSSESEVIGVIAVQDYHNMNAYSKFEHHTLEVIAKDICVFIERIKNLEDLTKAKEKAEESDLLKSTFLANMSHEIRTPLNSIVGFSDLLMDPDFDKDQYADFARIINNSGNSLLAIISDIMDISKIEAGQIKIHKTSFSVSGLLHVIHKQNSFIAAEKGLELRINVDQELEYFVMESDENRLRQVLVNFVGNAIKFTTKGFVEIGAKVRDNVVLFYVTDTGIGIPGEFHDEIFDRFRQVEEAENRKYGGNGLGLAISKSLVELLGGEIGIESEPGKGSTFYFTIPK